MNNTNNSKRALDGDRSSGEQSGTARSLVGFRWRNDYCFTVYSACEGDRGPRVGYDIWTTIKSRRIRADLCHYLGPMGFPQCLYVSSVLHAVFDLFGDYMGRLEGDSQPQVGCIKSDSLSCNSHNSDYVGVRSRLGSRLLEGFIQSRSSSSLLIRHYSNQLFL